jgi:uncharacterized membrane protein YeaQ/YmgE (transglycosylase-associated protein family)
MSLIEYVIVGLLAGFVGRAFVPGRPDPIRWLSLLVGVVGAVVGGLIGEVLYRTRPGSFSTGAILFAIFGAAIFLGIYLLSTARSRRSR